MSTPRPARVSPARCLDLRSVTTTAGPPNDDPVPAGRLSGSYQLSALKYLRGK